MTKSDLEMLTDLYKTLERSLKQNVDIYNFINYYSKKYNMETRKNKIIG